MDPYVLAKGGTESHHQQALFCWAQQNLDRYPALRLMFAVPNGAFRHQATAARLKAEGVKSGVPDIFLPVPRGDFHGCFIELKKPCSGRVAPEQDKWAADLRAQGYHHAFCYGWEQARDMLVMYLSL